MRSFLVQFPGVPSPPKAASLPHVKLRPAHLITGLAALLGGCAFWTDNGRDPFPAEERMEASGPAVGYTPDIQGEMDDDLRDLLREASRLFRFRDRAPSSVQHLRRRAERDVEVLDRVLRSQSYYDAKLRYRLEEAGDGIAAILEVDPGPPFLLQAYRVHYRGLDAPAAVELPRTAEDIELQAGTRVTATAILEAEQRVLRRLAETGYPFAQVTDRKAVADFTAKTLTVDMEVETGELVHFGELRIEGARDVAPDFPRKMIPWTSGDRYDKSQVENFERDLMGTGLYRSANVRFPPLAEREAGDPIPLVLTVEEADHRSIGGGIRYSTDEGFGVTAFWEHRNLFDEGERLRLTTRVAETGRLAGATFTKPAFLRPDQTLLSDITAEHESPEGYNRTGIETTLGLERVLSDTITVQGRVSAEYSAIEDPFGRRNVLLFGLPLVSRFDTTDSLLNPTKGFRSSLTLTPFTGTDEQGQMTFLRSRLGASTYWPLDEDRRFVGAIRASLGSIVGIERERIPAHHRFYAGGGGSVRGYGPQLVGPLDADNDPLGGRAITEVGIEMRMRIWENIGIVPFLEGGNVTSGSVPDPTGPFRWAVGLGGRYYTSFGPIRFDVAVPLQQRDGVDDAFQFYVSVGQAF